MTMVNSLSISNMKDLSPQFLQNRSIVKLWGWNSSTCGYCNNVQSSCVFGVWSDHLHPRDYFLLLNRGWRRSGKFLYRPNNGVSCCQQLTIRMQADHFNPSKSQRKVMRRFQRYLQSAPSKLNSNQEIDSLKPDGRHTKRKQAKAMLKRPRHGTSGNGKMNIEKSTKSLFHSLIQQALLSLNKSQLGIPESLNLSNLQHHLEFRPPVSQDFPNQKRRGKKLPTTANVTSNIAFILAAAERSYLPSSTSQHLIERQMILSNAIANSLRSLANSNVIRHVESTFPGFINIWTDSLLPESPDSSYEDPDVQKLAKHPKNLRTLSLPHGRTLKIDLVRATFERDAFKLYQRYQQVIHNSPPKNNSERSYQGFLVDSPLISNDLKGYGSYHMRYMIDGKLIAVGVVDLLPGCLSSVYFFYDPDLKNLSLGVVSVFKEIEWIRNIGVKCLNLNLRWYYMGYAIYGCQKMEYKFRFRPGFILDDNTWSWIPVENILKEFQNGKKNNNKKKKNGRIECKSWEKNFCSEEMDLNGLDFHHELILTSNFEITKFRLLAKRAHMFHVEFEEINNLIKMWFRLVGIEGKSRFLYICNDII